MNILILSSLARAQDLYPVTIICFVMQANHMHLLIRVCDPEHVSSFIRYFKAESAHYLNRLLNRRQRTVWAARFDSPVVLDLNKALELFAYCSLNPVKDGLVRSMCDYPGVSSYPHLAKGEKSISVVSIPRNKVPVLADPTRPYAENNRIVDLLSSDKFARLNLVLSPESLRLAYPESMQQSEGDFCRRLVDTLEQYQRAYQQSLAGRKVLGRDKLILASVLARHEPPIVGRKMICLSTYREHRQDFVLTFKRLRRLCRLIFLRWKLGDLTASYPAGMFCPAAPRRANLIPQMLR